MAENLKIGEKIIPSELHKELCLRNFYSMEELVKVMSRSMKVWSWGAHKWTKFSDYVLGFKVNGHHHKGWVYVMVGFSDTFLVVYTNTHNKVIDIRENVYIDELINTIDTKVEFIEEYQN